MEDSLKLNQSMIKMKLVKKIIKIKKKIFKIAIFYRNFLQKKEEKFKVQCVHITDHKTMFLIWPNIDLKKN